MSNRLEDYDFALPRELIANRPLPRRDEARMMVLDRGRSALRHAWIRDLPEFLRPGDLAILNRSRVIRARIKCPQVRGEILLTERVGARLWQCLVKPGRKFRVGARIGIAGNGFVVQDIREDGARVIAFDQEPNLEREGEMPIPPYFHREADAGDIERYQTTFAREPGSIAAPTAGLHFTPELLSRIPHAFLTLHVGVGTFLPVKSPELSSHAMHAERYEIPEETVAAANQATRILAVGTTTTRVLESQPPGPLHAQAGTTSIFIRPPHVFHHVGALLTNFHLPRSTLLVLVSAFAGRERILEAYAEAVRARYRFFSYGDCMLIL